MTIRFVLPTQRLLSLGAAALALMAIAPIAATTSHAETTSAESATVVVAESETPSPEAPPAEEAPAPEGEEGNFVGVGESTNWWVWALVAIGLFFAIDIVLLLIGARKRRRAGKSSAAMEAGADGFTASMAPGGAPAPPRPRHAYGHDETDEELNALQLRLEEQRDQLETVRTYLAELDTQMQRDRAALEEAQVSILTEREELDALRADIAAREHALSAEADRVRTWSEQLKADQSRLVEDSEHLRAAQDDIAQRVMELESEIARLDQARISLDQAQTTIDEDRAALAAERQSFEADRERWYTEVEQPRTGGAMAELAESTAPDLTEISSDELAAEGGKLIAARDAVISEGERLAALQAALEVDLVQLAEERQRSESLRYELEALRADLNQRDAQLLTDRAAIDEATAALEKERAAFQAERTKFESEREHRIAEPEQPRNDIPVVEPEQPREDATVVEPEQPSDATAEPGSDTPVVLPATERIEEVPAIEEKTVVVAKTVSPAPPAADQAWDSLSDEERAAFEAIARVLTESPTTEMAAEQGAAVVSKVNPVTETRRRSKVRLWPSRSGRNKKSGTSPVSSVATEAGPDTAHVWGSLSDEERAAFEAAAQEFDLK